MMEGYKSLYKGPKLLSTKEVEERLRERRKTDALYSLMFMQHRLLYSDIEEDTIITKPSIFEQLNNFLKKYIKDKKWIRMET